MNQPYGSYPSVPSPTSNAAADQRARWSMYLGAASLLLTCLSGIPAIILGALAISTASPPAKKQAIIGIGLGAATSSVAVALVVVAALMPAPVHGDKTPASVASVVASMSAAPGALVMPPASVAEPLSPEATATRLAKLASRAVTPSAFVAQHRDDFWALRASGERDCEGHSLSEPRGEPAPEGLDQFERLDAAKKASLARNEAIAKRTAIAAELTGALIKFEWSGTLTPEDLAEADGPMSSVYRASSVSDPDNFPFEAHLSEYDLAKGQYRLVLVAKKDARWPLGTEQAPVSSVHQSASIGTREKTGLTIGGKDVEVRGAQALGFYEVSNRSRLVVGLAMSQEEARQLAKGVDVRLLIVERVSGAKFYKACRREVLVPGQPAFVDDDGIGDVFSAKTVGYEVSAAGKQLAAHYDEAEIAKLSNN